MDKPFGGLLWRGIRRFASFAERNGLSGAPSAHGGIHAALTAAARFAEPTVRLYT